MTTKLLSHYENDNHIQHFMKLKVSDSVHFEAEAG